MSESRPITATNNDKSQVVVHWAQVPDDNIRYDTNDKEEEEQAWLEAERAEREKAEAERAVQEAKEERACKEEEKHRAEEEKDTEQKCKAKASKGDEARGEVKKVVMDPGKADKGKKQKTDKENAKARPSNQKWARMSSRPIEVLDLGEPEASAARYSGLENKLERLIEAVGLIANNLASLFKLHKTVVENSGRIADVLEALLDELYSFSVAVSPSDSGSSELDSDELCEEAEWLKAHSKDEEEESEGEDESMAEAK
ncbi:hypothetical protein M404DRAFT_33334 [Pisolithus tinctorius Marx 270]|uniref:Uncharacterized protein n=1 Tax=Pisolithus tinctorius Marx 270 TaxID=870435 RepID=A0A0C3N5M5_PISTI|nr:hypothetical protein M404DRAFT_33334 [Pisolithus tinctorius Marx 270]